MNYKWQTEPRLFRLLAQSPLIEANTIAHADNRIPIDCVITTQVGAVEHIDNTVAIEEDIAVIMPTQDTLYIILTKHFRHFGPIVHIAREQRIMRENEDWCRVK